MPATGRGAAVRRVHGVGLRARLGQLDEVRPGGVYHPKRRSVRPGFARDAWVVTIFASETARNAHTPVVRPHARKDVALAALTGDERPRFGRRVRVRVLTFVDLDRRGRRRHPNQPQREDRLGLSWSPRFPRCALRQRRHRVELPHDDQLQALRGGGDRREGRRAPGRRERAGGRRVYVMRFTPSGALDATFGSRGTATISDTGVSFMAMCHKRRSSAEPQGARVTIPGARRTSSSSRVKRGSPRRKASQA